MSAPKKPRVKHVKQMRVLMNDGSAVRTSMAKADTLVCTGKAKFISRTIYNALTSGLNYKSIKGKTDVEIKDMMALAKEKREKSREKREKDKKTV